jgi:hypothetical protein
MKPLSKILLFAMVLPFASCQTSKDLHKFSAKESLKTVASKDSIDNSKIETVTTTTTTTSYGDTLNGGLYFPSSITTDSSYANGTIYTDSLESSGIKVTGELQKTASGYKVKIKAIAKPKNIEQHSTEKKTEQKAVAVTSNTTAEKKSEVQTKDLHTKSFPVGIIYTIALLLLLVVVARYLYKKYKPF